MTLPKPHFGVDMPLPIVAAKDTIGVWHVSRSHAGSVAEVQCGSPIICEVFATARSAIDLAEIEYPRRPMRCMACWGS